MDTAYINIEKECGALGGLFQQIVNDMKGSSPVWEDFIAKTIKLNNTLKATIMASSAFLDSFQRVADMATNRKGASRDVGSALTRLCLRHKSIETKLKSFSQSLVEMLVIPLQEKMEEWKKNVVQIDKDHAKEYKKARAEIKRASSDTLRLQKKVRKGKGDMQNKLDNAMQDVTDKYLLLEETEKNAVRTVMIEERSHFCHFVYCLKPVVDKEIAMLTEVTHLQEIIQQLCLHGGDPTHLPPASEQVIHDISKNDGQSSFSFQTPPSSPSSLGSRKSSMCSISSLNSSASSGSSKSHPSPSHHIYRQRHPSQPLPPGALRLSSVSSQDSGFVSQDTLFLRPPSPHAAQDNDRKSSLQDSSSSGSGTGTESNATTPSPSFPTPTSGSTWTNWPDLPHGRNMDVPGTVERPHTISTAYEKGHTRPSLTNQTFEPPDNDNRQPSTAPTSPSPYAVPFGGSQRPPPAPGPKPRSRHVAPPTIPEHKTPPEYVNQSDVAYMAAQKGLELRHSRVPEETEEEITAEEEDDDKTPTSPKATVHRSFSMPAKAPNSNDLADAIKELEASTAELQFGFEKSRNSVQCSSGYGTLNSTPSCSEDTICSGDLDESVPSVSEPVTPTNSPDNYCTIPRTRACFRSERNRDLTSSFRGLPRRPASMAGLPITSSPGTGRNDSGGGTATIRRASFNSASKPPPPIRRNSSITSVPVSIPMVPGSKDKPREDPNKITYRHSASEPTFRTKENEIDERETVKHDSLKKKKGVPAHLEPVVVPQQEPSPDRELSPVYQQCSSPIYAEPQIVRPIESPAVDSSQRISAPPSGPQMVPPSATVTSGPQLTAPPSGKASDKLIESSDDELPLPPPPMELLQPDATYATLNGETERNRTGSIVDKHGDIMQCLNNKLSPNSGPPCAPKGDTPHNGPPPTYAKPNVTRRTSEMDKQNDSDSDCDSPRGSSELARSGSFLHQIRHGVKLRKSISHDRSAPKF